MKFLVIGKVTSGQTNRLREEARKVGHKLENCSSFDLVIEVSEEKFYPSLKGKPIEGYDLIYLLTVGDRKWEWYLVCHYLKQKSGIAIVEEKMVDPSYKIFFTPAAELLKQYNEKIRFPKTVVVLSDRTLTYALTDFKYPVIVKRGSLQRGLGVHLAHSFAEVERIIANDEESSSFLIREFIPNDGDIRVFTIGYKAVGAMKRIPAQGEFRANISRGGRGENFDLKKYPEIARIAEKISEMNNTEIAGVDIILHKETGEPYVLEINRGPQFRGLEQASGVNVAGEMIKYFEKKANQK